MTPDTTIYPHNNSYVKEELGTIFKTVVAPLAYCITPNQFEAEILSGA